MMKGIRQFVALLLMWLTALSLYGQDLTQSIDSLIRVYRPMKVSQVGIAVYDLTEGRHLYGHNAQMLFRPASTQKIITAVTAAMVLGHDYEFLTSLSCNGELRGDTLHGDLIVWGGLDPLFSEEDMDEMVSAVVSRGIKCVDGSLLGDVSLMDSIYWGPGWSYDDAPGYYQPYISPLMLCGGSVEVKVTPSSSGNPNVKISPESDFYTVRREERKQVRPRVKMEATRNWLTGGNEILLLHLTNRPYTARLSMYPSDKFFLYTLLYKLRQKGVSVLKDVSAVRSHSPNLLKGLTYLSTIRRPLSDVMERALKKSDNLCAEAMFIHLGLTVPDALLSGFEEGKEAVEKYMKEMMLISPHDCNVMDGSGLSPYNLVSPEQMMSYLKRGEWDEMFCSSLPVAATDGTLANRMKNGKAAGNVRAKTGSVTGVSTLAGYVNQTSTGHRLAFVIFCQNILKQRDARHFQDKVCEILAR